MVADGFWTQINSWYPISFADILDEPTEYDRPSSLAASTRVRPSAARSGRRWASAGVKFVVPRGFAMAPILAQTAPCLGAVAAKSSYPGTSVVRQQPRSLRVLQQAWIPLPHTVACGTVAQRQAPRPRSPSRTSPIVRPAASSGLWAGGAPPRRETQPRGSPRARDPRR